MDFELKTLKRCKCRMLAQTQKIPSLRRYFPAVHDRKNFPVIEKFNSKEIRRDHNPRCIMN